MVQPLLDKINRLENKLNDLVGLYNAHTHVVTNATPVIAAPVIAGAPLITETIITPLTARDELENKKVQHGAGA
jgi:type II secretory pathway component PulM